MMYFFEEADYSASKDHAAEELEMGRKSTPEESLAEARKVGFRVGKRNLEIKPYTGHHERLCERADDQGVLHACNDTWLEVRTWNNDIRGVMTLFGVAIYWLFAWLMGARLLINQGYIYLTGHELNGSVFPPSDLVASTVMVVCVTALAIPATWAMHRYFLRYELFTQRWIRLRFNRVTKKVYLLRPKYAGGLMVFDWTLTEPNVGAHIAPSDPLLTWGVMGWMPIAVGERSTMQFVGRRTTFKTQGDWMAFWEYIRRYMEEGPAAVPKPQSVIGYGPSLKESWLSVTQWFPALQQKGALGKISDGITLLILPLIGLLVVGNFVGQCLTWQARFPKEIEQAGKAA